MVRFTCALLSASSLTLVVAAAAGAAAGKEFDLQGFIDKAVEAGEKRIVIPPGRYRVKPRNCQHLVLRGLTDVEIVADGVEMICTETTRALTIHECRNVTLRGMTIDYDPLPYTQGRIVKLSEDKRFHEIELFEGYPPAEQVRNFKYEIFRPDTRTLRCHSHYPHEVEVLGPRRIRIDTGGGSAADPEQVGDIIAIGSAYAPGGSWAHAVECARNVNVRLENIDLYASNCFGFLEYECDGSTYYRCRIDRRSPDSDFKRRADPRIRSLDADAFHSKHAIKGPALIECVARFMGDDAINICGDYHMVTECRGAELRVLAKHSMNVEVGDPVEILAYDGTRLPDAKVVRMERDGKMNDDEKAFLLEQNMNEHFKTRWNADAYRVTLDRAVDLPRGTLLGSTRRMGNGFLVQGCDFGFNRGRGILIKASDGKVVGNKLTQNWIEAVKVSPEYWWLESGSSNNVEVSGNVIRDCFSTGIAVYAHGARGLAPAGAHSNIVVSDNTLVDCRGASVLLTSTKDAVVKGNRFVRSRDDREGDAPDLVEVRNCAGVLFEGNRVLERDAGDDTPLEEAKGWHAVTSAAQGGFNIDRRTVEGLAFAPTPDWAALRLVRSDELAGERDIDGMHAAAVRRLHPPNIVDWPEMTVNRRPAFRDDAFFGTALREGRRRRFAVEPGGVRLTVGNEGYFRSRGPSAKLNGGEVEIALVPLVITGEADGDIKRVVLTHRRKTIYEGRFAAGGGDQERGRVEFERWDGIAGRSVTDLTSSERYKGEPDGIVTADRFEAPTNTGDDYGLRTRCILRPPTTGEYTFWIAGDDGVSLRLSDDRDPGRAREIASHDAWTQPREWERWPTQKSAPVRLEGGKEYYVEVFMKEALGGDHVAVAWKGPGIEREVIPGKYLAPVRRVVHSVTLLLPAGARGAVYGLSVNGSEPVELKVEFDRAGAPAPVRLDLRAGGERFSVRTPAAPARR